MNIRNHEPRTALDGGPDGLRIVEMVVQDAAIALRPAGFLFMEIGDTQAATVKSMMASNGFREVRVCKDLSGRDRVVSGSLIGD